VKNAPDWLREAVAEHGVKFLAGTETRAEAEAAVTAAILDHPEYLADLAAIHAAAHVAAWVKANASSGDLFQVSLFPRIPVLMQVNVGPPVRTADMTAADLDKAKSIILARTRNAREAADRDAEDFTRFYDRVRPRLKDGKTVKDALAEIATEGDAAGLAAQEATA
jgi:hypothetical protein